MSFRVLSLIFSVFVISGLGLYLGAPNKTNGANQVEEVCIIRIDPEGSLEEQLAYHISEIKKYQEAVLKEEANAKLNLIMSQMNEVRQANSRKFQYSKKIEEHKMAIEGLQASR